MQHRPRTLAAIAAASLLAAFAAQANKGAEYKPTHSKEHHKNFFITAGATYLEPSQNMLDYLNITTYNFPIPGSPFMAKSETVEPEFDWGYFVAAGYRISHHYDVQASWAQFNSDLSDSTSVVGNGLLTIVSLPAGIIETLSFGETADASSKQTIDYSVFDATLGQYHNITEMLRARTFVGVRYAKVDSDTDNHYLIPSAQRLYTDVSDDFDSSFSGVGPEVGLDLEYKFFKRLGMAGHLAAAFLIGSQESEYTFTSNTTNTVLDAKADSVTRLIPALDAKLGLNWNVPYETNWGFSVEGGYQVAYYFDVIDQYAIQSTGAAAKIQHNYSDYGNMGPYLNFTAMF